MGYRRVGFYLITGVLLASGAAFSSEEKPSCDDIIAVYEEGGGGTSADEVAAKLKVSVERVRECMKKPDANPPGNPPAAGEKQ
jgi:hypothetical protein